jgi:hypothetical protein
MWSVATPEGGNLRRLCQASGSMKRARCNGIRGALLVLGLACRNGDMGSPAQAPPIGGAGATSKEMRAAPTEPSSTAPPLADAGSAAPGCAPPRESAYCSGSGDDRWARNPQTGECCHYDAPCAAPWQWPSFESESECQTSCRCTDLTAGEYPQIVTERTSLECACADGQCGQETLDEAILQACSGPSEIPLTMVRGCGMVELRWSGGYSGSSRVFDRETGALIGRARFSDTPMRPCAAVTVIMGREFVCEGAAECVLCPGDAGAAASSELPVCD